MGVGAEAHLEAAVLELEDGVGACQSESFEPGYGERREEGGRERELGR